ncbi:MAG: hypothetical protein ACK5KR_01070 [Breznakia sp.]
MKKWIKIIAISVCMYSGLVWMNKAYLERSDIRLLLGMISAVCGFAFWHIVVENRQKNVGDQREEEVRESGTALKDTHPFLDVEAFQKQQQRLFMLPIIIICTITMGIVGVATIQLQRASMSSVFDQVEIFEKYDTMANDEQVIYEETWPAIRVIGKVDTTYVERLKQAYIYTQPKILLENVGTFFLCDDVAFQEVTKDFHMEDEMTVAFALKNRDYVFLNIKKYNIGETITHELGHLYDFTQGDISETKQFQKLFNDAKDNGLEDAYIISNIEYALSSPAEFFAEVTSAYFHYPDELKVYPALYFYMESVYGVVETIEYKDVTH